MSVVDDPFDLERFVAAQAIVLDDVMAELQAGRKRTHWMWFVFPQLVSLGSSSMARRYAIGSLAEARQYLAHPLLGSQLVRCTTLVNAVRDRSLREIFGSPDDVKFHSSMTLFHAAGPDVPEFAAALATWFGGVPDRATTRLLAARA